jgi:hypothetical protein
MNRPIPFKRPANVVLAEMAAALRTFDATACESDAIRCLMGLDRWAYGDIAVMVDLALLTARRELAQDAITQTIVADTMAGG